MRFIIIFIDDIGVWLHSLRFGVDIDFLVDGHPQFIQGVVSYTHIIFNLILIECIHYESIEV